MDLLKAEYNKLIITLNKAVKFMDDVTIPDTDKDKHHERFIQVIDRLNKLVGDIEKQGYKMSENEILDGFKGVI